MKTFNKITCVNIVQIHHPIGLITNSYNILIQVAYAHITELLDISGYGYG